MSSKNIAVVDQYRCVACGACVKVCPKSAMIVQKGSYAVPELSICVGCGLCEKTCPADCISIVERGAVDEEKEKMV